MYLLEFYLWENGREQTIIIGPFPAVLTSAPPTGSSRKPVSRLRIRLPTMIDCFPLCLYLKILLCLAKWMLLGSFFKSFFTCFPLLWSGPDSCMFSELYTGAKRSRVKGSKWFFLFSMPIFFLPVWVSFTLNTASVTGFSVDVDWLDLSDPEHENPSNNIRQLSVRSLSVIIKQSCEFQLKRISISFEFQLFQ